MQPLKILTWFWRQQPERGGFDAEKVNRWAAQFRPNLTIPYTLACVTDEPAGIDPDIEIIPPPREFEDVEIPNWSERMGAPLCYRRLAMFAPHAAELFGAERFVCTDIDMIATDLLDPVFDHEDDFRIFAGTSRKRPYNGSMLQMTAGARPEVYETFKADPVGVARRARSLYIGSDQAVISMILGDRDERRWTQKDGVYAWSRAFARRQSRRRRPSRGAILPPANMRIMFFPGYDNPWDREKFRGAEWIPAAWYDSIKPPQTLAEIQRHSHRHRRRQCLWAYDDPKSWGRLFNQAARSVSGQRCRLFIRADRPPPDARCFVRLDQQGKQRDISRDLCLALADRGAITLPTRQEAIWYDDKVAQLEVLRRWLPHTVVLRDAVRARAVAQAASSGLGGLSYPFVSKAAQGAGSANVREITSAAGAEAEIAAAFEGRGLELSYGRRQRGYLYWQALVPDQRCDYRICVTGPYWYGLVRYVRPGTITASGSGNHEPILDATGRARAAAELALEISAVIGTEWMCYDFVFTPDGVPLVLEMSSAWTMKSYRTCPMFDAAMRPTSKTGADSFRIAVDVLRRLEKRE